MTLSALLIALIGFACRDIVSPHETDIPPAARSLSPGTVVVSPGDMHGWSFLNDQTNAACTDRTACRFVQGPASPPMGTGSVELATATASDGVALVLQAYQGTRLDVITELRYATHRQTVDSENNLAIALQFNVDYDVTDQAAGYEGRLVFEPYQRNGGGVSEDADSAGS